LYIRVSQVKKWNSLRIQWHIFFWVLYVFIESLIVFNVGEWGHRSLWHSFVYHSSLLIPRTIFTYVFLIYILPYLTKGNQHILIRTILVILYFAIGLLIYRTFLNKISWPWIMDHWPDFNPFDVRLSSYSFLRLVTPLSLLLGILSVRKEYYLKLRNEQLQKEQLRSELNYLKAQINPHFLFNSFNNLYVLAVEQSDKTAPAIEKLSSLFRYILQSSSREDISIKDELMVLKNYVELEKLRYQNVQIDFNTKVIDSSRKIPPLLMLPFIENAFKHGASELLNDGYIKIDIQQKDNQLNLVCENTFDPENAEDNKSGEGIMNVTKRLHLLFPGDHVLEQSCNDNIYKVELTFPIGTNSKPESK